jgi:phosphate transport system permease protein
MTEQTTTAERASESAGGPVPQASLHQPRLPRWAPALSLVGAAAVAGVLCLLTGWGAVAFAFLTFLLHAVLLTGWSRTVENRRAATDRLMTSLVWSAFALSMAPLVSLVFTVLRNGLPAISGEFLTGTMRNVIGPGGGILHAIVGTLLVTLGAAVISVPIGLMTAVYLVEYAGGGRMGRTITFLVDVMTGIPSIVAGLFAYALFALILGPGIRMGFGGSVALSLLMVPIVVRSCEEMLKLVPNDLREAAYALGVPKWLTITKVVIPTSLAGIVTGITLAVARVAGETAPLLIIAGKTDSVSWNLFGHSPMTTLPVFTYYSFTQPGVPPQFGQERAWGAALVLILIVMALNLLARVVGARFAPRKAR